MSMVRLIVLAATGLLAGLGIPLSARLSAVNPHVAVGWELDVIAAVIVGELACRAALARSGAPWSASSSSAWSSTA